MATNRLTSRPSNTRTASVKTARKQLVRLASRNPRAMASALTELSDHFGKLASKIDNTKANLGLNSRRTASEFRRIAEECPEEVTDALNEIYSDIDEAAGAIEALAENTGLKLDVEGNNEGEAE